MIPTWCGCLLAAVLATGCTYNGVVPVSPYKTTSPNDKISATIFYRERSSQITPIHIGQWFEIYHIEVAEAVDTAFLSMLRSRFARVNTGEPGDAQLMAEPRFIMKAPRESDSGFIDAELQLVISDVATGKRTKAFQAASDARYTIPGSAQCLSVFTGLTFCIFSPITFPAAMGLCGDRMVDLAREEIPEMVGEIDSRLRSQRNQIESLLPKE